MIAFETLYDYVLPYVPGASEPMVDNTIARVARQFLRKTTLQRETLSVPLDAGNNAPALTPAPFFSIAGVLGVRCSNGSSTWSLGALDEAQRAHAEDIGSPGTPTAYFVFPPATLLVYAVPDKAFTLAVRVYDTLPLLGVTSLPDSLGDFIDILAHGVIAYLMAMPNRAWSDASHAMLYQKLYGDRTLALRDKIRGGNGVYVVHPILMGAP